MWRVWGFGLGIGIAVLVSGGWAGRYAGALPGITLIQQACWLTIVPILVVLGSPWAQLGATLHLMGAPMHVRGHGRDIGPSWQMRVIAVVAPITLLMMLYATPLASWLFWANWGAVAIHIWSFALGLLLASAILGWDGRAPVVHLGPAGWWSGLVVLMLGVVLARGEVVAGGYFGLLVPAYSDDLIAEQRVGCIAVLGLLATWMVGLVIVRQVVATASRTRVARP